MEYTSTITTKRWTGKMSLLGVITLTQPF